jgi:hypothetical protein
MIENSPCITREDIEIIHRLWELLCSKTSNPHHERKESMITITSELQGILTAAQAQAQEIANPTQSVLTPSDLALLDQTATVLGAPTSTSTPVAVASTPAPSPSPSVPASSASQ